MGGRCPKAAPSLNCVDRNPVSSTLPRLCASLRGPFHFSHHNVLIRQVQKLHLQSRDWDMEPNCPHPSCEASLYSTHFKTHAALIHNIRLEHVSLRLYGSPRRLRKKEVYLWGSASVMMMCQDPPRRINLRFALSHSRTILGVSIHK
jgi:hypothetical protein